MMRAHQWLTVLVAWGALLLAGCGGETPDSTTDPAPQDGAREAQEPADAGRDDTSDSSSPDAAEASDSSDDGPGLAVGAEAPDVTLYTRSGEPVQLASLIEEGPIVLMFYRGGWCPYCEGALTEWQERLGELQSAGGTLIAVSPESPDHAAETVEKNELSFRVLGDPDHSAAEAFRVGFSVDDATKTKYEGFGLDVGSWNASGEWNLPAPGTFVIDTDGVIRWAWADWDYKQRAEPDEVIAFVRTME